MNGTVLYWSLIGLGMFTLVNKADSNILNTINIMGAFCACYCAKEAWSKE